MRIRYVAMATIGVFAGAGWLGAQDSARDEVQIREGLGKAAVNMRMLHTALESYLIDTNAFPVSTTDPAWRQDGEKLPAGVPQFRRGDFKAGSRGNSGAFGLTTPIAYIHPYPVQEFGSEKHPYAYYTTGTTYLIWTPGPDGRYEVDWNEFDPDAAQQSAEFHAAYSYDPTNGVVSGGDLWFSRSDSAAVLTKVVEDAKRAAERRERDRPMNLLRSIAEAAENSTPEGRLDSALRTMRTVDTALETYYIDNNAYPVYTTAPQQQIGPNALPDGIPTFHRFMPASYHIKRQDDQLVRHNLSLLSTLTTPISYLTKMPEDPYVQAPSPFAYISRESTWMVWSPGPDGRYDIDAEALSSKPEWPEPEFLVKYRYDPSNGTVSSGDVVREK